MYSVILLSLPATAEKTGAEETAEKMADRKGREVHVLREGEEMMNSLCHFSEDENGSLIYTITEGNAK